MPWPQLTDYQEAIQHPARCFSDPELRHGTPLLDALGLPRPVTGGFASVYQIESGGRRYAVRCFNRPAPDVAERYRLIDQHLRATNVPATVMFEYLTRGIQIRGAWYPVLKMEWLDGDPLHLYVERHLDRPWAIRLLAHQFAQLTADLERHGIAHGDLQHGNILVVNGALRLIDYDGMYVPALAGQPSQELGHRNYQHPRRSDADFGPHLDHFAAWVIYSSLVAVSQQPALWRQLRGGDECLLFRREDFARPATSPALAALASQGDDTAARLVTTMRSLLDLDELTHVPSLSRAIVPAATAAGGVGPAPDWARPEFLSAAGATLSAPAPPAPVAADAGLVRMSGAGAVERLMLAAALIVAVMAVLAAAAGAATPALAATFAGTAATGALVALAWRYGHRDEVAQKRRLRAEAHHLARVSGRTQRQLARVAARVDAVSRDEGRALARLQPKQQTVDQRQAIELSRIGQRLTAVLDRLDIERQRLLTAEAAEAAQALRRWHDQLVTQRLGRQWLMAAPITGFGVALKARLLAAGVRTAADIAHVRVQVGGDAVEIVVAGVGPVRVAGIGPARAAALASWRRSLETEVRAGLPASLPPAQTNALRARFASRRAAIDAQVTAARADAQARGDRVRLAFGKKRADLDEQSRIVRDRYGRDRVRLERERRELRDRLDEQQARATAIQTELAAYDAVTVRAYVRRLVWLSNSA